MATNSFTYAPTRGALQTYAEGTDPIVVALVAGYVYDEDHADLADITNELSGGGYARRTLTGVDWVVTDGVGYFEADNATFPSLTAMGVDGIVVACDQGADSASPLIAYISIAPTNSTAESFVVQWASGRIVDVSDASPTVVSVAGIEADSAGDVQLSSLVDAFAPYFASVATSGGSAPLFADILVRSDGFDPTVGTFTSVVQVGPLGTEGNRIATQARATLVGYTVAVIDTGKRWVITASGACTAATTPKGGQEVIVGAPESGGLLTMIGSNGAYITDPTADATSLVLDNRAAYARRCNNVAAALADGGGAANSIIVDPAAEVYVGGAYDGLPIYRLAGFTPGDGGSLTFGGQSFTDPQTVVYCANQLNTALNGVWELFTDSAGDYGTAGDAYFVRTKVWNSTTDDDSTSPMLQPEGNVFRVNGGTNAGLWVTRADGLDADAEAIVLDGGGGSTAISGVVSGQDEGSAVANTTTETTLLDSAPTITATAGELVKVTAGGTYTNDSGAGRVPTFRLKVGGTTMLSWSSSLTANATARPWHMHATLRVEASGDVNGSGTLMLHTLDIAPSVGTSSAAIQSGATVDLTIQHETATNLQTCTLSYIAIERIRSTT